VEGGIPAAGKHAGEFYRAKKGFKASRRPRSLVTARRGAWPAQQIRNFLAAKERKERKEKNRIFPVKAPFFPESVFLCVLCVLLWLNSPFPFRG